MPAAVDLPDVNVWLALSLADHPHHDRARHYWSEEAAERLTFTRVTALGLLRLLTNTAVMGGQPFALPEAWRAYGAFRRLAEVFLAQEPEGCEAIMEEWVTSDRLTTRHWTDAYLAAFALAAGFRLVSFDSDFKRYQGLDFLWLTSMLS